MAQYQVGQKVKYTAIGGGNVENSTTTGEIVEVITGSEPAGDSGVTVKVSRPRSAYIFAHLLISSSSGY
ncbi:hypothetical protein RSOL_520770 [Rhizoctonia solani AG-3 Rhs1AP]|uniref:Hypervirulence associated protein TUDOR domain-containing protein n=2 Tax=Rhizoctonia solani AG-3 TaxID=1086053 RepID=A0A074SC97_9AGAM|nr:hypothetical protein RSOL_520770 [Rhizoctonia solani AG-3 Rhs1AP]KEP54493.1 hypothetical protein V565_016420 [Rhizoctonia solani 123E]